MPEFKTRRCIMVCHGSYCNANNRSLEILKAFRQALKDVNVAEVWDAQFSGCMGFCTHAQMVAMSPDGTPYHRVHMKDVPEIVQSHCVQGQVLEAKKLKFDAPH